MDLSSILAIAASIPVIGKIVAGVIAIDLALKALVNALVGSWKALVLVAQALASIPGCSGLQSLVVKLQADSDVIDEGSSKVLSLLDRLSSLQIPQASKPSQS